MLQRQLALRLAHYSHIRILVFASLGLLTFLILADAVIKIRPFAARPFWAVLDVLVHGLVAIIVTFPLVAVYQDTKSTILLFVTIYLTATLIDLDHFAAAGSLDFSDALNLHVRPMTHSLTFAFMVGGVSYLLLRNPIISLALFLALASHVIRDAAGGPTPILWPLPFQSVPWWVYYAGEVLILCLSYLVMTKARLD